MRTLVDIPDQQIRALAELCERSNQPRAELIRQAIAEYLAKHPLVDADDAFGLWGATVSDGLKYQRKVRAEW